MLRLDAAAESDQDSGKGQRDSGENDQRECNHAFFDQAPDLW